MDILTSIGELSVDEFMRRHWQRRPFMARQALPNFSSPIDPAQLFAMAASDEVDSRLVSAFDGRWALQRGPIHRLPARRKPGWSLLVNGVDRHDDAMSALLQRFRFVPDARLDDLMVSFATDGGGVGPHVDSYDVFLLQARGKRRWRLSPPGDGGLVSGAPLKLLARFEPTESWLLEPGDMLYVPPGWGHEGVADGECISFSIGFRAPSRHEFLAAYLSAASDSPAGPDPRFSDRGRVAAKRPGELPADLVEQLQTWARTWRPTTAEIDRFIGCYLTEPPPSVWFDGPERPLSDAAFDRAAATRGLRLDRCTRMAWRGMRLFINGECIDPPAGIRGWVRRLADVRSLSAADVSAALANASLAELLRAWYAAGWLLIGKEQG
jgi:50S ribosomal protein L16 3-hydroxylase